MAKKKKTFDPVQSLMNAFNEEIKDTELLERYNRFQKDLSHAKQKHNELVPTVNENLRTINTLKESVLSNALLGIISTEVNEAIKNLEVENGKLIYQIEHWKEKIEENETLIKNYKDWSERELFTWWKAIQAVNPETKPWLEWKEQYKDVII